MSTDNLTPYFESIIVARKPLEGSCIDNILAYGVGAYNIDECRIGTDTIITNGARKRPMVGDTRTGAALGMFQETDPINSEHQGRYPSNIILTYNEDDYDEVCGGMPYTKSTGGSGEASQGFSGNIYGKYNHDKSISHLGGLGDEGSAARYFYCAKASTRDRDEGLEQLKFPQYVSIDDIPDEVLEDIKRLLNL